MNPTETARKIYADLRQSATHSLPTEQARERYDLWGEEFDPILVRRKPRPSGRG